MQGALPQPGVQPLYPVLSLWVGPVGSQYFLYLPTSMTHPAPWGLPKNLASNFGTKKEIWNDMRHHSLLRALQTKALLQTFYVPLSWPGQQTGCWIRQGPIDMLPSKIKGESLGTFLMKDLWSKKVFWLWPISYEAKEIFSNSSITKNIFLSTVPEERQCYFFCFLYEEWHCRVFAIWGRTKENEIFKK